MQHPFFQLANPVIIGHRGAAGSVPENTLLSFEHALACGAQVLESDIHATRDGIPVLIHDPDVARTTQGKGAVENLTLSELHTLDAGHHFSTDGGASFPKRDHGTRIPTLEEAFRAFPDARFNLEIKAPGDVLSERVVDLVETFGRAETTLLTAGEDPIMQTLRAVKHARNSPFAIGASTADVLACIQAALNHGPPPEGVMALQIPETFAGRPLVTSQLIAFAQSCEIALHVWTINERDAMRRLLDLGVDGLITDYPDRMAALLGRA